VGKTRVVIVGGGFAGAYCARQLERIREADQIRVTLIDRSDYLLFYPLLVEAGIGTLEPRHVVAPIRSFASKTDFRMAEVVGVDLGRGRVSCREEVTGTRTEIAYDHLILAPGSVTNLPEVPGLREHGFQLKGLADAVTLRDRAVALLEAASAEPDVERRKELLHFVVVGANFTGVEVAGEYDHYLRRAVRRFPSLRPGDHRVTLVERDGRILPALDLDLADYARGQLENRGIDVRLNTTVTAIGPRHVELSNGERLAARTVLWCAGIAPSPLVARIDLPKDERGYIECGPDCRVSGRDDVWAIGDAAVNVDKTGRPAPATAQQAVRQGRHLARNLGLAVSGRQPLPLVARSAGSVAALGCRTGVAKLFGLKLSGFPAWWLYRTVYLWKMPGLARKIRIAIDWTLDLVFPRDVVQLGVHRARLHERDEGQDETVEPPAAKQVGS
jgi:NADH dehydrogenase